MVYTKKLYLEITSIDRVTDDKIYLSLKKNIPDSFIKMYIVKQMTRADVK